MYYILWYNRINPPTKTIIHRNRKNYIYYYFPMNDCFSRWIYAYLIYLHVEVYARYTIIKKILYFITIELTKRVIH